MADPIEPTAAARPSIGLGAAALILGAIGVVFGDIGTSPLYTLQECLHSRHGVPPSPENVMGVVSLIVWSVTMVVTVKYLGFMMRADNKGEGGIMALLALALPKASPARWARRVGRHPRRAGRGLAVWRRDHYAGHFRPLGRGRA